jgi:DNA polymerase-3 subunit gamma/tau
MNLYLKYRPQTIDELDLSGVREAFGRLISSNKVAHAYLFTGPRGAGKTSSARILARVVNCEKNKGKLAEPCNECPACKEISRGSALDVIEIDAASNRGIDDIRELKEKIRLAPSSLTYKVYIIDEVHMLTTEAFNALLKTLEEPPKHTLFILCTTELHKVPETIVSRCMQVSFYKASPAELSRSLKRVLQGEGATLSEEILTYIGAHVDGSFRDGVKLVEQILSGGSDVSLESVQKILSGGVGYAPEVWVTHMLNRDTSLALSLLREATNQGVDLTYFLVNAMQTLRAGMLSPYQLAESSLVVEPVTGVALVYLLDKTARLLAQAPCPELLVETMVIEWCQDGSNPESTVKPIEAKTEPKVEAPTKSDPKNKTIEEEIIKDQIMDGAQVRSLWRKMLSSLDKTQYSLEALLSKASPSKIVGRNLMVSVAYDFHKSQLETTRFRDSVESVVAKTFGMPLTVVYEVSRSDGTMIEPTSDIVAEAAEIFV